MNVASGRVLQSDAGTRGQDNLLKMMRVRLHVVRQADTKFEHWALVALPLGPLGPQNIQYLLVNRKETLNHYRQPRTCA